MSRPVVWLNVATGVSSTELVGCTDEPRRHGCEAKYVADMANDRQRAAYLSGVENRRGRAECARLRTDAWRVMNGRPISDEMEKR